MSELRPNTPEVTPADLADAAGQMRVSQRGVLPGSLGLSALVQLAATGLVLAIEPDLAGWALGGWITAVTLAILTPTAVTVVGIASRRTGRQLAQSLARERAMADEAHRRDFEARLTNALDMAEAEPAVLAATARALEIAVPGGRIEVLLADNSHAHLKHTLVSGPDPAGPGCGVQSPERCVAARRGQTQRFSDSEDLDACPHLRDRAIGRCGAVCVPVSIMGRTIGVVHWAEPAPAHLPDTGAISLEMVAKQLGARIGMLRVMGESQLQASTDGLTGLPNRRAFENTLRQLRHDGVDCSIVLADLDHFKVLNDTYGHECGDRALRTYADVLRTGLRPTDVACRYGGEEFALAFPGRTPSEAAAACERLRDALTVATQGGELPPFSASYGVAPSSPGASLEHHLALADEALYRSKARGRNRVTVHDLSSGSEVGRQVELTSPHRA